MYRTWKHFGLALAWLKGFSDPDNLFRSEGAGLQE